MLYKSQVFTSASGSVGGLTYARNRYGSYTRSRSNPVNPNSTRQAGARARFAASIDGWTTLTNAQRTNWSLYADAVPGLNRLGESVILTGQNMYVRSASLRAQLGETVVAVAPITFNRGVPASSVIELEIDVLAATMTVNIDGGASAIGDLAVFLGRPQNLSRKFYAGPYQFAVKIPIAAAAINAGATFTFATMGSEYIPVVGTLTPVKVVAVYDDGRVSTELKQMIAGAAA